MSVCLIRGEKIEIGLAIEQKLLAETIAHMHNIIIYR